MVRKSPSGISLRKALKQCGLESKAFAIIYVNEDGNVNHAIYPSQLPAPQIFSKRFDDNFLAIARHTNILASVPSPTGLDYCPKQNNDLLESSMKRKRALTPSESLSNKRSSSNSLSEDDGWRDGAGPESFEDDDDFQCASVRVDDEEALIGYYRERFEKMQQLPCKAINKAWVRVIQPKKQARNPYNGGRKSKKGKDAGKEIDGNNESEEKGTEGELTKPDWWPITGCRHREPDHIYKHEQLTLLLHILRNLSPHKYHGTDGNAVTVHALRQSTKDLPSINGVVASWLEEIYYTREQEEDFLYRRSNGSDMITIRLPKKMPKSKRSKAKHRAMEKPSTSPASTSPASTSPASTSPASNSPASTSQRKPGSDALFTTSSIEHNNSANFSSPREDTRLNYIKYEPSSASANARRTFLVPRQLSNSHTLLSNPFSPAQSHNPINRDVTQPSDLLNIPGRSSAKSKPASSSNRTNLNNALVPQTPHDSITTQEYPTSIPIGSFQCQHPQPNLQTQGGSNSHSFILGSAQQQLQLPLQLQLQLQQQQQQRQQQQQQQHHQQEQPQLHSQQMFVLQLRSQQPPQQQQQHKFHQLGQPDPAVWGPQGYYFQGETTDGQAYNGAMEGVPGEEAQAMGYWV